MQHSSSSGLMVNVTITVRLYITASSTLYIREFGTSGIAFTEGNQALFNRK
jgi:hypothetical protein